MKKNVLTSIRAMEMVEAPAPRITAADDVLLRLGVMGVCGSDVHYYETGRIGSQVVLYPFTVGHECGATVEAVGPAVTRVKPGDRVAVEPAISCHTCDQCLEGRPHTCRNLLFLGCPGQVEGCLAEYLVMPELCCFPIPDAMTLQQAALSEPLAIGLYAARLAELSPSSRIGILGCGPIGMSVLLCARNDGVASALVTDLIPARLEMARAHGADWVEQGDDDPAAARIKELGLDQLDVVFECCGQQAALDQALELLKPGGTLMLVGIPREDRVSFSIDLLRRKELRVQNVRRQCHCVQPALDLIARGEIPVDALATHHYPFEQTKDAFDLVADYRDGVMKAMIEFQHI